MKTIFKECTPNEALVALQDGIYIERYDCGKWRSTVIIEIDIEYRKAVEVKERKPIEGWVRINSIRVNKMEHDDIFIHEVIEE